jgi:pimeloyl-ACP methyl ester carboxylesterase
MEHVTSRDGTRIAYWRSGSGLPLLLVHGTTADHRRWDAVLPRLEEHFTVYTMDRRGRGESGDAPDYDILREAEDVAAVVEAIGEPTAVLGHSFGGLCALEAALLTDRISHLLLYEPPIPGSADLYPPGVPERMQALIDAGELEPALEIMMREVVGMPNHELEVYRSLPMWPIRVTITPTIPRELHHELSGTFDPDRYAKLAVPTLLLTGGDSPRIMYEVIERLHAVLPHSRIASMPGQQHIAMDLAPELFVGGILRFLLDQ